MLRAITLPAALLAIAPRVAARLWESIAQTEAPYGGPLQKFSGERPGEEQRRYQFRRFYVLVTFVRGRSEEEVCFRVDKSGFSEGEIQRFLKMNSEGKPWQKSPELPIWKLSAPEVGSFSAIAAYYPKTRKAIPLLGIVTNARAKTRRLIP